MDELPMIRRLLDEPPPSPHVVEEGRARLLRAQAADSPRTGARRTPIRPVFRGALVIGLTAAAVAATLAVATVVPSDDTSQGGESLSRDGSARNVLLAVAVSAESVPTDGTFWHLRALSGTTLPKKFGQGDNSYELEHLSVTEQWTANNGRTWLGRREWVRPATSDDEAAWQGDGSPSEWCEGQTDTDPPKPICLHTSPGTAFLTRAGEDTFVVVEGRDLTFDQLQRLPDEPNDLRNWVIDAVGDDLDESASAEIVDLNVADVLVNLLVDVPTPPEVRAAAFRALADMPNVKNVGPMRDELGRAGVGIEIETLLDEGAVYIIGAGDPVETEGLTRTLIIDPDTSHVLASEERVDDNTDPLVATQYLEVGWTDEEPREPAMP